MEYLKSLVTCISLDIETPPQRAALTRIRFLVFLRVLELVTLRLVPPPPPSSSLLSSVTILLSWLKQDSTVVCVQVAATI